MSDSFSDPTPTNPPPVPTPVAVPVMDYDTPAADRSSRRCLIVSSSGLRAGSCHHRALV
jgi:hypothetical protein